MLINPFNLFNNPEKRQAYAQLMRIDKPIGNYLLLWPTLWALWFAAGGAPQWPILVIFVAGVYVMRAAGCVINDYADRDFDGHVERTQQRPLARKAVTEKEALGLFFTLLLIALGLVIWLNWQTIALSLVAVLLAACYPFMKRFTYLPQFVLGAAFSWSMPMAFMAIQTELPAYLWLLYIANLVWTVAYDTLYAMVDRDDDLKIGIKSTAILFGRFDLIIVAGLQYLFIALLVYCGWLNNLGWIYYLGLVIASGLLIYQQWSVKERDKQACFQAFLNNHYVGMLVFIGLAVDMAV